MYYHQRKFHQGTLHNCFLKRNFHLEPLHKLTLKHFIPSATALSINDWLSKTACYEVPHLIIKGIAFHGLTTPSMTHLFWPIEQADSLLSSSLYQAESFKYITRLTGIPEV